MGGEKFIRLSRAWRSDRHDRRCRLDRHRNSQTRARVRNENAWDHEREALRSFALDRVRHPRPGEGRARDLPETELDQHLASSYGIFSGAPKATATIRFSAHAARWVADEHWHSKQEGRHLPDGGYELKLPYSNPRELLMDILRYGPDAEIVEPASLRNEVRILLQLALAAYGG